MAEAEDESLWVCVWEVDEARPRGGMVEIEGQQVCRRQRPARVRVRENRTASEEMVSSRRVVDNRINAYAHFRSS